MKHWVKLAEASPPKFAWEEANVNIVMVMPWEEDLDITTNTMIGIQRGLNVERKPLKSHNLVTWEA